MYGIIETEASSRKRWENENDSTLCSQFSARAASNSFCSILQVYKVLTTGTWWWTWSSCKRIGDGVLSVFANFIRFSTHWVFAFLCHHNPKTFIRCHYIYTKRSLVLKNTCALQLWYSLFFRNLDHLNTFGNCEHKKPLCSQLLTLQFEEGKVADKINFTYK